jgi:hypothetical protein
MDQIYKNAFRLVVCLGKPNSDTDEAMDAIYPLKLAYEASEKSSKFKSPELLSSLTAVGTLLRRDWFTRIWVIQEMAVARSTTIVCGFRAVHLYDFIRVLAGIMLWGHEAQIRALDPTVLNDTSFLRPPEGYGNGVRMSEIMFRLRERKPIPLPEALMALCHFNSKEPKDKIHAILGFTEDADKKGFSQITVRPLRVYTPKWPSIF